MSKAGESLLRGAREALDYARGARKGFVAHVPERKALFVEELTDADLEAIGRAKVPPEHDHLDLEYEDRVTSLIVERARARRVKETRRQD